MESFFHLEKEGKTAKEKEHEALEARSQKHKMGTLVLDSILFLCVYMPHTWSGELNFKECYET